MSRKTTRQLRLKQIKEYRASGLSLKEWCDKNGEKFTTMRYWSQMERESRSQETQNSSTVIEKENSSWVQLAPITSDQAKAPDMKSSTMRTPCFKLNVNDMILEIPRGYDAHELKSVIEVMRSC